MASPLSPALQRPIALAGFMGAGKSTVGRLLAQRLGRPFADGDAEVERRAGCSVRELFERDGRGRVPCARGERDARAPGARRRPGDRARRRRARASEATRALVRERAFCAWLDVPSATAWQRVEGAAGARPLAGDAASFAQLADAAHRRLHGRRGRASSRGDEPRRGHRGRARAAGLDARGPRRARARRRAPSTIADARRSRSRAAAPRDRDRGRRGGEVARRRWSALARARRARSSSARDVVVCAGGGSVTDVGGFAAATFRRGVPWLARARRRSSARSMRRSAARRRSTSPPRTTSVRSGSPRPCSATPSCWRRCRRASGPAAWPRSSRRRCSRAGGCGSSSRAGSRGPASSRSAASSCSAARASRRSSWRATRRIAGAGRSSISGTRSATASRPWPATAASRTASASRSGWSPRCACRSGSRASRAGTAEHIARLLTRHRLPVRAAGARPGRRCWRRCATTRSARAGTHRMVLLEAIGRPVYGVSVDDAVLADAVRAATAAH